MNILYVANRHDPLKHNQGSGTDFDIYNVLISSGFRINVVGPFSYPPTRLERIFRQIHKLFSKKKALKYPLSYLKKSAGEVEKAIEKYKPDIIVTFSGAPLFLAKIKSPLVYIIDTTVFGSQKQRPTFSKFSYFLMLFWEKSLIRKCNHIITFSEWSAKILKDQYGISEELISFFPIPASIPEDKVPNRLSTKNINKEKINLLLVGRNYQRKGVETALEVADKINKKGIRTELRIIGINGSSTDYVNYFDFFNKTKDSELEKYLDQYRWADFLIHPAKFEAAGIVASEAAAFGVPTITNAAGGLATTVKNGFSGIVLPKDSPADMYVKTILDFYNNVLDYKLLRESTRKYYEENLKWTILGKHLVGIINSVYHQGN